MKNIFWSWFELLGMLVQQLSIEYFLINFAKRSVAKMQFIFYFYSRQIIQVHITTNPGSFYFCDNVFPLGGGGSPCPRHQWQWSSSPEPSVQHQCERRRAYTHFCGQSQSARCRQWTQCTAHLQHHCWQPGWSLLYQWHGEKNGWYGVVVPRSYVRIKNEYPITLFFWLKLADCLRVSNQRVVDDV